MRAESELGGEADSALIFPGAGGADPSPGIASPFGGATRPCHICVGPATVFVCTRSRAIPDSPASRERWAAPAEVVCEDAGSSVSQGVPCHVAPPQLFLSICACCPLALFPAQHWSCLCNSSFHSGQPSLFLLNSPCSITFGSCSPKRSCSPSTPHLTSAGPTTIHGGIVGVFFRCRQKMSTRTIAEEPFKLTTKVCEHEASSSCLKNASSNSS